MSVLKHYPLGSFPGQDFWFSICVPDNLDPNKKYMLWPVCPGQGEAENNIGDQHSCVRIATHGMFANLRAAVDKYPLMLIFVNTPITSKFKNKEVLKCIKWAIENLPVDEKRIFTFGHSLGWWGLGNYGFTDAELAAMVRGTFPSASGPYTSTPELWDNLEKNDIIIWGATALNDTAMKTKPVYTQQIKDKLPKNKVMIFQFPATRYPDQEQAHNSMAIQLSKITGLEMKADMVRASGVHVSPLMNIYEWAWSNPKGSVYQSPEKLFTGPIWPESAPVPTDSPVVVPDPGTPPVQAPQPAPIPSPINPPVVPTPSTPEEPKKVRIGAHYFFNKNGVQMRVQYSDGTQGPILGIGNNIWVPDSDIKHPTITPAKGPSKHVDAS